MGGVYTYTLFHDILRGGKKERGGGRKKGEGREGEREKTGYGFVITESFSYLCMRDRYLDRQTNRTSIVPLHIKTD